MFDDTLPCDGKPGLPAATMQRAKGAASCSFKQRDGQTVLDGLRQSGCFKVRFPKVPANRPPEAVLLNTAGGLTDGDRLDFEGSIAAGGAATFTTQAAERAYEAQGRHPAEVNTRLTAGEGARLYWLPQETILFDGAALSRSLDIDLAEGASLLAIESIVFGRQAMGEVVSRGYFQDRWRVRRCGQIVHADDLRLDGDINGALQKPSVLNGAIAMATILYVSEDAESLIDVLREKFDGKAFGISAWAGKLMVRAVASSSVELRRTTQGILTTLMDGDALPRVWSL